MGEDMLGQEISLDEEQLRALNRFEMALRYEEEAKERLESVKGNEALYEEARAMAREAKTLLDAANTQAESYPTEGISPPLFTFRAGGSILSSYGRTGKVEQRPLRTVGMQAMSITAGKYKGYEMPGLNLLLPRDESIFPSREDLLTEAYHLEQALAGRGVKCAVSRAENLPRHLLYELSCQEDLSSETLYNALRGLWEGGGELSLVPLSPGRFELLVEKSQADPVYLSELASSSRFLLTRGLVLALGKEERGEGLYADLLSLPHLLLGGDAGSGKTNFLHLVIMSILYHARPQDAQLVLVDPAGERLKAYEKIPQLLWPLPPSVREGVLLLTRLALELDLRRETFSRAGVGNYVKYSALVEEEEREGKKKLKRLPRLVIVIPEVGPLMREDREESRKALLALAQEGEKAGMHLVLSTGEPVYWVLDARIRHYIPARIAFRCNSAVESMMLLGSFGAEHLLGAGDMLCLLPGMEAPQRCQSTFVFHRELENVITFLAKQNM